MKFTPLLSVIIVILCCSNNIRAQQIDSILRAPSEKIYKVNPYISGGIGVLGLLTNVLGLPGILDKDSISVEELDGLASRKLARINRVALRLNPDRRENAGKISDYIMYTSGALPVFLILDRKIRKDFLDVGLMYFETLAITSNIYTHSPLGPRYIDSYRPFAYYTDLPLSERTGGTQRNSFFSGHVSTTATGTFFTAKVLADYHPEWGSRRAILYGIAAIPPSIVAIQRVQALKHFPSDVIIGAMIGSGMGILMPFLHKKWQKKAMMSAIYTPDFKGGALLVKF